MEMILIEVLGGVIQNIEVTEKIPIFVIDHDDLKSGAETSEMRIGQFPYFVGTKKEIDKHIDKILKPYENFEQEKP